MLRPMLPASLLLTLLTACAGGDSGAAKPGTTAKEEPEPEFHDTGMLDPNPEPEPEPPKPAMKDGFWIAEGAPEPRACEQDLDCIGAVPPGDGGCCNDPIRLEAYSTKYRDWLYGWRKDHCADVECPPPPAPAQPAECYFKVTCSEGTCQDTCPAPGETEGATDPEDSK